MDLTAYMEDPSGLENNFVYETLIKVDSLCITWKIENYSVIEKSFKKAIISNEFSTKLHRDIKWILHLYPAGNDPEWTNFVGLYLHVNSRKYPVNAQYYLKILNTSNKELKRRLYCHTFTGKEGCGSSRLISNDYLSDVLQTKPQNDTIIFQCLIKFSVEVKVNSYSLKYEEKVEPNDLPVQHMNNLFENSLYSDVTINVEEKDLMVHTCILSINSSVFKSMFDQGSQKRNWKKNKIVLNDITYNGTLELMRYMYLGKINNLEPLANELAYAANKYEMDNMKLYLDSHLSKVIRLDNVLDLLKLSNTFNLKKLKQCCSNFAINNGDKLIETPKFKEAAPELFADLFNSMMLKSKESLTVSNNTQTPPKKKIKTN